jgi:glyoxylate reductase
VPERERPPLILIDAAIPSEPIALLEGTAEVVRYAGRTELDKLVEVRGPEIMGLGTLLSTMVDADLLAGLPNLRVIANHAVGVDNVDLAAARARGIIVTHTPDVLTQATADLTWTLILAVGRRLREGEALLRSGSWTDWHPQLLLGKELQGATLVVLGLGRIGAAVAQRALGFGMEVVYWNRSPKPDLERELGIQRLDLDGALTVGDVVSIHLPLTEETRHLIDAGRLECMKQSAILINTARGPIVDESALADALEEGRLFGAGLDVYEDEPRVHSRLLAHPRTVLLPHLGSATEAARTAMARLVAENLHAVLAGRPAVTPVSGRH